MRALRSRGFTIALVGLAAWLLLAAGQPALAASKDAQIDALVRVSGLDRQVQQIPALIQQQLQQRLASDKSKLPKETQAVMGRAMVEAYDPDSMLKAIRRHIDDQYDEAKAAKALEWLMGALGRRLTELEVAGATPEGANGLRAFAQSLQSTPVKQERIQLMVRLDDATGVTQQTVQMVLAMFDGVMRGLMAADPVEKRPSAQQMDQIKAQIQERVAGPLRNQTIVTFLYNYRDVSQEDMERAIAFYQSEAGQWYQSTTAEGLMKAMAEGGERFGRSVEDDLKHQPKRS